MAQNENQKTPPSAKQSGPKPKQAGEDAGRDHAGLFKRPNAPDENSAAAFHQLRDEGLHAFRNHEDARAIVLLSQATSLRPGAPVVKRALAEALLRAGRAQAAFDIAHAVLTEREDPRLRRTHAYAARALLRDAMAGADADAFHRISAQAKEDLTAGVNGPPFLLLLGGVAQNRADVQSAIAQMTARARFDATQAQKALAELTDEERAAAPPPLSVADRVSAVYATIADDARALFDIDSAAAVFIMDVAISAAPDEPRLRAERLWFALARAELDNPRQLLDYALDRRVFGNSLPELARLTRFMAELRAPDAVTRAIRALRTRQRAILSAARPEIADLAAAGALALDFGDFTAAEVARDRLMGRPEPEAQTALTALEAADASARLAAGDLVAQYDAAAQEFWEELLHLRDPLPAFFDHLPDDIANIIIPPRLLTCGPEERGLRSYRHTLAAALRVFARRGIRPGLRLFPWSPRELERTPRGVPVFAHMGRRGPRANRFLTHAPGALPNFAIVDRFGVEGWSETAQSLPYVEARDTEVAAFYETARAAILGPDFEALAARAAAQTPPDTVIALLQEATDPRMELARFSPRDMLRELVAWAGQRGRRVLILRPPGCRHLGLTELLDQLALADHVTVARAPTVQGALGRLMLDAAGLVTVNAPAAVEALVAMKRVILCADADYHHIADSLERADQIPDALDRVDAPLDRLTTARFFYDYLTGPTLNLLAPVEMEAKLTAKLKEGGWIA